MSNLTHLARFLSWVSNLPTGTHLGKEICSQADKLSFLKFFIDQPILYLYARIFVDGESRSLEGFIVAMTIDPENNLFSAQIVNEPLEKPLVYITTLDKLRELDQLSTDSFIERAKTVAFQKCQPPTATMNVSPPSRRFACNLNLTELYRQL